MHQYLAQGYLGLLEESGINYQGLSNTKCLEQSGAWALGLQGLLIHMITSVFETLGMNTLIWTDVVRQEFYIRIAADVKTL